MKTTTIILATLLTLQVSILFAGNESTTSSASPVASTLDITSLVPVTPAEATFEEVNTITIDFAALIPETPAVADFEEIDQAIRLTDLAPHTPLVADFE